MTGREFDFIAAVAVPAVLLAAAAVTRLFPSRGWLSNVDRPYVAEHEPTLAPPSDLPKRVPGAIYEAIDAECKRYRLEAA